VRTLIVPKRSNIKFGRQRERKKITSLPFSDSRERERGEKNSIAKPGGKKLEKIFFDTLPQLPRPSLSSLIVLYTGLTHTQ
jgi:hypothetical protein